MKLSSLPTPRPRVPPADPSDNAARMLGLVLVLGFVSWFCFIAGILVGSGRLPFFP